MKCPECLEEVVVGDLHCPYCGAELEDEGESELEEDRGLAPLMSVADEAEASGIKELLEVNGIPVVIHSQKRASERADYHYSIDTWGEVLVNRGDLESSLLILQKYMDTQRSLLIQEEDVDEEEPGQD
ncbi:MAG: hypothetical protein RDV48_05015 [Candidatus Eremiobacteraeota bacterium]|nr:hypothetical protein [Candidatus Eremiobacteraeota bacterium]